MYYKIKSILNTAILLSTVAIAISTAFADATGVITASENSQLCAVALQGRNYTWKIMPTLETGAGIVGAGGVISFPTPLTGARDICIKVEGALSVKLTSINMGETIDLGTIIVNLPDLMNDDVWDDFELNEINGAFGESVTSGSGVDYNCDGLYDDFDLNQINGGFGSQGGCYGVFTNEIHPGEMIYIPAGSFLMGNNGNELFSYPDEFPQHSVYISGFWMGKYEVTRGEYRQFMDAGGYTNSSYWTTAGWNWKVSKNRTKPVFWDEAQNWSSGTFTQTENHPVVGVSYYEASAYCTWAGGRLPTDAEWEKAARWDGSAPRVYTWGNAWLPEYCNNYYDTNSAGGGYGKFQTAPVGSYSQALSYYGCYDMTGNVWELCYDWYGRNYYSQTPGGGWIDPQGPASGSYKSFRGGGWDSFDNSCRCAYRTGGYYPSLEEYYLGFRMAR